MTAEERQFPRRWPRYTLMAAGSLLLGGVIVTHAMRQADRRDRDRVWAALEARAERTPARFDPVMVAGLPEPARRYFLRAIAPGTPLKTVAVITMGGRFGLGDRNKHDFYPMEARQIIAPPHGFLWVAAFGSGAMQMDGSDALLDGEAWTRFWMAGAAPLVRASGAGDLGRSAIGRLIGESLWAPASLLPGKGVRWEALDADRARVVMTVNGEDHAFDLRVAADGTPLEVTLRRWSNVNPDKIWRWQPFGATFKAVGTFEGFTVPTSVKGGNHFGTENYFPFFQAEVERVEFR